MATRLPYYVGGDDIYTQLMRQFESEVPYYSAAPAGIAGGYDPSLYSRLMQPMPVAADLTGDYSGLLGGGGDFGMQSPTTSTTGTGFSLSGLLGGPAASTAAPSAEFAGKTFKKKKSPKTPGLRPRGFLLGRTAGDEN